MILIYKFPKKNWIVSEWVTSAGLFDCGANRVHGTALLKYRGAPDKSPFDGPTSYSDYVNIKGIKGMLHK